MSGIQLADRVKLLETESAFEVLEKANRLQAQGMEVVHLEIGEPDFSTDSSVLQAAARALEEGHTKYGPPVGLPALRQAIAGHAGARRGIEVLSEQVVVTPGAKPILFFAMQACVNPGDEVILPDPGFPIYQSVIRYCGAVPKHVPIIEKDDNFTMDLDALEAAITPRTRAIILNSPHNPTGGIIPQEDMAAIVSLLQDKNILVISDEIYSDIYYDEPPITIASFPGMREKTIIIDGFSKSYAMTGWRLGYGIMPKMLVEQFSKLAVNVHSCTPPFVQLAGVEALKEGQASLERMVKEFKERRDILVEGLRNINGFRCPTPKGAFYAFPNIEGTGFDSKTLANKLLEEGGVAALNGSSFGEAGNGYLRFSYANSQENITKALEKIDAVLSSKKTRNII
ncbi:pyridoxal phosphate-dependent aminotransferase [Metallumcola ferriviriculae]|uniref:Aminotransferase n=1 Tax=Metallumcola ferriviriculae TaxID=3039180 RepID=A0AAU0USC5_9FIRM|nr:pyridoxal phosphate-dependent aminotransferase [Desulfitibacteraceae bacterium MK1]